MTNLASGAELHAKSQQVRVADVLILGPAMLFLGWRGGQLSGLERLFLAGTGAATIVYNYQNWKRTKEVEGYGVPVAGN